VNVKNRIVNSAHQARFASDGHFTDRYIAYQRERAHGGTTVVVAHATSVAPDYLDLKNHDGTIIEESRRIGESVHELGALFRRGLPPGRQREYARWTTSPAATCRPPTTRSTTRSASGFPTSG
jgi:2,4-dienoyl-CoA reductase-like NADH-dependent reductase (Old Yellow Enzyme family)